ncbi:MAG TPA: ketoacyl-ACP synthase III [Spirochaetes bacterium]|nr:ketoacyl-ACP synthase III [Spirochaetota bacterium]
MIKSTGSYLPEKVLSNKDLENIVDTTDEWITTRTGIKTRRLAAEDEATSDLAFEAAKVALQRAEISPEEVDLIIVGTISPDNFFPSTGCLVQNKLGAKNAVAMDINAACSGYLFSLVIASRLLDGGNYKNALIIGAEKLSSFVNWEDRATCVLFADGAGASVLVPSNGESRLLAFDLGSDGSYGKDLLVPAGGSRQPATIETVEQKLHSIVMNGNAIFKIAVNKMRETFTKSMEKAGVTVDDISLVIPHQANLRIIESLRNFLKLPKEKVFVNIEKYGNTSAASIGIALDEAHQQGIIKRGDIIGLTAFGGGLTWGSAIIKF